MATDSDKAREGEREGESASRREILFDKRERGGQKSRRKTERDRESDREREFFIQFFILRLLTLYK
jgi:hypothetical protein